MINWIFRKQTVRPWRAVTSRYCTCRAQTFWREAVKFKNVSFSINKKSSNCIFLVCRWCYWTLVVKLGFYQANICPTKHNQKYFHIFATNRSKEIYGNIYVFVSWGIFAWSKPSLGPYPLDGVCFIRPQNLIYWSAIILFNLI